MATKRALEQMGAQIERIRQIAARWSAEEPVPEVERELLLGKLRALYEEVLFLDAALEKPNVLATNDTVSPNTTLENDVSSTTVLSEPSDGDRSQIDSAASVSEESSGLETVMDTAGECSTEEIQSEETASPSGEPMTVVWEQQPATAGSKSSDQKLFSDEPLVRSRVDKQVILSLYGEETSASASRPLTEVRQPVAQPLMEPEQPEISSVEEPRKSAVEVSFQVNVTEEPQSVASGHVPFGTANGATPKVLGEMIAPAGESLGERLGRQHPHTDVASRLRASTVTDLRHSIGINDRFLLLNELFGGDTALYERTITRLNEFTSLDEAMIYIQEHFEWNPDSEGATFLVELLERKLEN